MAANHLHQTLYDREINDPQSDNRNTFEILSQNLKRFVVIQIHNALDVYASRTFSREEIKRKFLA